MQLILLFGVLASARLLRSSQTPVLSGVPATVLPNAHPDEWQECTKECPVLDTVATKCMEDEGEMYVHPQCFHHTCEVATCLANKPMPGKEAPAPDGDAKCEPVREEIWSKVNEVNHDMDLFVSECSAGTFDCLAKCPDLHALLVDNNALSMCKGGNASRAACENWVVRMHDCVSRHGICGASTFGRIPNLGNITTFAANGTIISDDEIGELRTVAQSMKAVVRAAQEAFEATFMNACDPTCASGEECIHGRCTYRPFGTRHTSKVGKGKTPDWFKDFEEDNPHHPQRIR